MISSSHAQHPCAILHSYKLYYGQPLETAVLYMPCLSTEAQQVALPSLTCQNHADRWISYAKLPLGVNECGNICVSGMMPSQQGLTKNMIKGPAS